MVTLINKKNPLVKIIVPEVCEGERFFIISEDYIHQDYHTGGMYLYKKNWDIINN